MNTSYFANPNIRLKKYNDNLVSVSKKPPAWMKIDRIYIPLCPNWSLVKNYKENKISEEEYTNIYYENYLNKLDPLVTFNELGGNAVLLCFEKSGKFCHRRLIAEWLEKELNIPILELPK